MTERALRWYLDTSAALKLLIAEPESAELAEAIAATHAGLSCCRLVETELRRAAQRINGLSQARVSEFLETVDLYEVTPALFRQAGLLPGAQLRSLDAIHLAAAVALDVDAICTYDRRLAEAAAHVGVAVAPQR